MNQVMKSAVASIIGLAIVGCAGSKKPSDGAMSSVTDVSPSPALSASAYQPVNPAPQPVIYDSAPFGGNTTASGGASASSGGTNKYTVKKGDTLYAIARKNYGDGKQWQKIASANPGLSPSSLKVGQTISIPN